MASLSVAMPCGFYHKTTCPCMARTQNRASALSLLKIGVVNSSFWGLRSQSLAPTPGTRSER